MGKAGRAQRMKQQARERSAWGRPPAPPAGEPISQLIARAGYALEAGDQQVAAGCVDTLTRERPRADVERAFQESLLLSVRGLWEGGWQPADVLRVVTRRLKPPHQQLVRAMIAAELAGYAPGTVEPRWWDQAAEGQMTVWWPPDVTAFQAVARARDSWSGLVLAAVELSGLLLRLPELERLDAVPGRAVASKSEPRAAVDERILARVRALLAKAESTNYPAEAETFTAGAQALMARHSIDHALLAATGKTSADAPVGRRIGIDNPYEGPKVSLLNAVASANRTRAVWTRDLGYATVVGHPTDLDLVEVLFTSLLVQGTAAMTREGGRTHTTGGSRTRSFRTAFLLAYAQRIRERLNESAEQAVREATESAGQSLLPVLTSRVEAVERATAELFPNIRTSRTSGTWDGEGWASGRAAADLASLSAATPVGRRGT